MEICDKAQELVQANSKKRDEELRALLQLCQSPVEQILFAALYDYWHAKIHPELKRLQCHLLGNYPAWDGLFIACVEPQKTLKTLIREHTYRVDFYIYLTRFRNNGGNVNCWPELGRLVVEVDGHEFHERTKQQASYDRKRDRELMLEGYRVIRFTGSDVYNYPYDCAEDIDFHVNDVAESILRDYMNRGKLEELILG